jgi:hypothetical protein
MREKSSIVIFTGVCHLQLHSHTASMLNLNDFPMCQKRAGIQIQAAPLLEGIARERPMKAQQTGKDLEGTVVVCKV